MTVSLMRSPAQCTLVLRLSVALALALSAIAAHAQSNIVLGRFGYVFKEREYPDQRSACTALLATLQPRETYDPATPPTDRENGNVPCFGKLPDGRPSFQMYGNDVSYTTICPANARARQSAPNPPTPECEREGHLVASGSSCVEASTLARQPSPPQRAASTDPTANVPPPNERGMTDIDDAVFQGLSMNLKLIFIVRESNPAAVNFTGKPGYLPKPETLKAKTIKAKSDADPNPNVGLAAANPADPRLKEMLADDYMTYPTYLLLLRKHGFKVGPAPDYLVLDIKTEAKFYSDIDLHGVYDLQGRPAWNDKLIEVFNTRLKDRLIQHGPHDCWLKRNTAEAGPNAGPQPPVTVYLPSGEMRYLKKPADMQRFYAQQKLGWPYAPGAKENWCNLPPPAKKK